MALFDVTDLKEYQNWQTNVPAGLDDTFLGNVVNRVSKEVERITGYALERATVTEYRDGDGSRYLQLLRGPIASSTVTVSVASYSTGGTVSTDLLDAGSYFVRGLRADGWNLPGFLEYHAGPWVSGQRNYFVEYVAGWDSTDIPGDIVEACLTIASFRLQSRKALGQRRREGPSSVSLDNRFPGELAEIVLPLLEPYIDERTGVHSG